VADRGQAGQTETKVAGTLPSGEMQAPTLSPGISPGHQRTTIGQRKNIGATHDLFLSVFANTEDLRKKVAW
jgi:hypothetical protein